MSLKSPLIFSYDYLEVLGSGEGSSSCHIRGYLTPSHITGDINPDHLVKVGPARSLYYKVDGLLFTRGFTMRASPMW